MKMSIKGNDCFETPNHIFKQLDNIYTFTLDAACNSDNKLCEIGCCHDLGVDGLNVSWEGERVFCNPPFSNKALWLEKAYKEVLEGDCPICVMILPTNCLDSKAWHEYVEGVASYEFLKGRVSFIHPTTKVAQSGNNSGTVIVYFKKKIIR